MVEAVLSVGSNTPERARNVALALDRLKDMLDECEASSIYTTPDCCGGPTQYDNAVVRGLTSRTREDLENIAKLYELSQGRDARARSAGIVPIDIDVVVYDGEIIRPKDFSSCFFRIGYDELKKDEKIMREG